MASESQDHDDHLEIPALFTSVFARKDDRNSSTDIMKTTNHEDYIEYVLTATPAPQSSPSHQDSLATPAPSELHQQVRYDDPNMKIVGALIGMIVLLILLFAYVITPYVRVYLRRLWPVSPKRIERRYVTIEGWLISKRVRKHDELCATRQSMKSSQQQEELPTVTSEKLVENVVESDDLKMATSYDTTDTVDLDSKDSTDVESDAEPSSQIDASAATLPYRRNSSIAEEKECPICMSPMLCGEIVSWSPNKACKHVYHHECIKEWLLHHINCPFCRETFLLCDEKPQQKLTKTRYNELAAIRRRRLLSTCYCEREGLIVLDSIFKHNGAFDDLQTNNITGGETILFRKHKAKALLEKRHLMVPSGVKKGELAKLRGSRVDHASIATATACNDGTVSICTIDLAYGVGSSDEPIAQTLNPTFSYDAADMEEAVPVVAEASSVQILSLASSTFNFSTSSSFDLDEQPDDVDVSDCEIGNRASVIRQSNL